MDHIKHNRRSIRLRGYDYSQAAVYFITICTYNRACFLGEVIDGEMLLNGLGEIVQKEWLKTEQLRANVKCDVFVLMPNHLHGILVVNGEGTARRAPTEEQFGKPVANSIPTTVRSFKAAATREINLLQNTPGHKLWQRNYYEHIVRDEYSYAKICEYIENNPLKWELDSLNPEKF